MKKILVVGNNILAVGDEITYGYTDKTEPDVKKWKIYNKTLNSVSFWIDDGFSVISVAEVPEDYAYGKYFYENGKFVLNKGWKRFIPAEERIAILEETVALQEEQLTVTDEITIGLYEAQIAQDEINLAYDESIIELYELYGSLL